MKTIKIIRTLIIATLLTTGILFAGISDSAGTKGMQFMKIGVDARGASLGGAIAGEDSGVSSLYWNPAGISATSNNEIRFGYNRWIGDMNNFVLSYGKSLDKSGLAVGVYFMDHGSLVLDSSSVAVDQTRSYDLEISGGYAKSLGVLSVGGALHFVRSQVFDDNSTGMAVDIGGQLRLENGFGAGLVVKSLGFASALADEKEGVPASINFGLSYNLVKMTKSSLLFLLQSDFYFDEMPKISLGAEYGFNKMIYGRVGYEIDTGSVGVLGGSSGLSFGLGAKVKNIGVDLSFLSFSELGSSLQGSVEVCF